ncbi:hypothetical protein [Nostoc parmelioides]|uniref:hypothetical protein n=1 Tax=Nostoc parmelioides TaxID=1521621 RepID=UPI001F551D68|nr:hypothetical protein [Nostoc parmelioides]
MNEKGAVAIAGRFAICPTDYQQRVEQAFALLAADTKSITEAIAILESIENDLNQWYENRLLVM